MRTSALFVQTSGLLLDVALKKAIDLGWIDGPRVVPAGHAISPTGGHFDPTMFQALAPHIMPLTVEEGIANGISEVRKAVRYQIKHGAELIKVCASGGVMSHTGPAGAQQYCNEELAAIADEAHRVGLKVAAHAHGDDGIRAAIEAGIDCIEHCSLATDETLDLMVERGLPRRDHLPGRWHGPLARRARAASQGGRGVPRARATISKAITRSPHRVRNRRAGDPARPERQGARCARRPRHDAAPGDPRRDDRFGELIDVDDRGRLSARTARRRHRRPR